MSLIKKETKGNFNSESPAFNYFIPDTGQEIKVERVFNKTYVAHFPDGAERISLRDMNEANWKCLGKWKETA